MSEKTHITNDGLKLGSHNPDIPLEINPAANNYASINGVEICYLDEGAGDVILFIHGGGACIETWNYQLSFFKQFRVIALDTRGHGRSSHSGEPLCMETLVSDTIQLLDSLGVDQANVVGWSDGATIGLHMAKKYPQRLRSLVMIGAMYSVDGYSTTAAKGAAEMKPSEYYPYLIDLHEKLSSTPWEVFFELCRPMWVSEPKHKLEELSKVRTNLLMILGGDDEWSDDAQARKMLAVVPNSQLYVLPGADHAPHLSHAEITNRIILSFIQKPHEKVLTT